MIGSGQGASQVSALAAARLGTVWVVFMLIPYSAGDAACRGELHRKVDRGQTREVRESINSRNEDTHCV